MWLDHHEVRFQHEQWAVWGVSKTKTRKRRSKTREGVLPYKGLMGTCSQPGYVFRDFCHKQGIDFIIFCLSQGIDFCLKQGRGMRGQTAPPHPRIYRVPPPPPGLRPKTPWTKTKTLGLQQRRSGLKRRPSQGVYHPRKDTLFEKLIKSIP